MMKVNIINLKATDKLILNIPSVYPKSVKEEIKKKIGDSIKSNKILLDIPDIPDDVTLTVLRFE